MSRLELRLLGPPEIKLNGSAVRLETRKATALLAYLAVAPGPRRRDTLVNLLWPDSSQTQGRNGLRQDLYRLNKALSGSNVLETDAETVALRSDPGLWVDVRQFHTCMAECRDHGHDSAAVCARCNEPLQKALALYRDTFLAGFTLKDSVNFDDWQLVHAENLRLELDFVLDRLVRSCSEARDYRQAIEHCRQWVALDRLNEHAHRRLMRLYVLNGQRPAALRQYRECETVLLREYEAAPEEPTTELFEAIRANRVAEAHEQGRPPETAALHAAATQQPKQPPAPAAPPRATRRDARLNLPAQLTNLIGRDKAAAALADLLSERRLLTLIGPGGSGKTRLAIHAAAERAEHFQDGVQFVALETVTDPGMVPQAVASALHLPEVPGESAADTVCRRLSAQDMLLVLDNFEQVAAASSFVSRLLAEATAVTILVTSREPLGLEGEQEFPVLPLDEQSAVELFVARARSVQPAFKLSPLNAVTVADICDHLDRLPLAIELAAARIKILAPDQLLVRLSRVLSAASHRSDVPERHRTMRNTVRWSYDLLTDDERLVFARLAVFSGGFSLGAAEAVCCHDLQGDPQAVLEALLHKSLIRQVPDAAGGARLGMFETIREFAARTFAEDPDADDVRSTHALFYCRMAEELGGVRSRGFLDRVRRLSADYENLRAALEWSASGGNPETGHRTTGSLQWFWSMRSLFTEGFEWVRQFLSLTEGVEAGVLGRTSLCGGSLQIALGNHDICREMLSAAETHARAAGDKETEAWALNWLSAVAMADPERQEAVEGRIRRAIELFREIDLPFGVVAAMNNIGELMRLQGRYDRALAEYTEAMRLSNEYGMQRNPAILGNIGDCQRHLGDTSAAAETFRQSLRFALEQGYGKALTAAAIESLASVAKNPARAVRLLGASDAIRESVDAAIEPADQPEHDEVVARIRSGLSEPDFERHFAEGRSLSFDEAVSEALEI